jgi:hypothetical protein
MVTPPNRRMTHIGVLVTGVGEPKEPFGQISPTHLPCSEVQPPGQRHRPEHEKAAQRPPLLHNTDHHHLT